MLRGGARIGCWVALGCLTACYAPSLDSSDGGGTAGDAMRPCLRGSDDFADDVSDPSWGYPWFGGASRYGESGGQAFISAASDGYYAGVTADVGSDYRDGWVALEVGQFGPEIDGVHLYLRLLGDDDEPLAGFELIASTVSLALISGSAGSVPFDLPQWWRMREGGGMIFFQVSPDGDTWLTAGMGPTPTQIDHARITFAAGIPYGVAKLAAVGIETLEWCTSP